MRSHLGLCMEHHVVVGAVGDRKDVGRLCTRGVARVRRVLSRSINRERAKGVARDQYIAHIGL